MQETGRVSKRQQHSTSYISNLTRAFRVIKYLHHSVNTKGIENQFTQMGHKVRNVIDGRHRVTKQPLNLFYVDLELAGNNKEMYTINWL
jgi:hypothetical protein